MTAIISLFVRFSCNTIEKKAGSMNASTGETKKETSPINDYRYTGLADTISL